MGRTRVEVAQRKLRAALDLIHGSETYMFDERDARALRALADAIEANIAHRLRTRAKLWAGRVQDLHIALEGHCYDCPQVCSPEQPCAERVRIASELEASEATLEAIDQVRFPA